MAVIDDTNKTIDELSIALCTCEGSFFLPAQLESLAEQSILPGEVVVCDDASTDGSLNIVEEFAKRVPFKVKIIVNGDRLGAKKILIKQFLFVMASILLSAAKMIFGVITF